MPNAFRCLIACVFCLTFCSASTFGFQEQVSFQNQIFPILKSHCAGCHCPSDSRGDFDVTNYQRLLTSGESGLPPIIAGDSNKSHLIEMIVKDSNGDAEMPLDSNPLNDDQILLLKKWVDQGAKDDSSVGGTPFSNGSPPTYRHLPVITSIDHDPSGNLLAVNGFNEVFILDADDYKTIHRLIGNSSRIETIRFSPDGKRLAVAGGTPGKFGEIQVWNVKSGRLELSKKLGGDCAFGVNWSPNGKLLSFGMTDTTVRCVDAESGDQVLYQGAHEDWVRDTVFSVNGKRLVSVGRDTTCKLIDVDTERFIDNLTSITPAILKGGISSIGRHPNRDEVVIGCADGIVKVYRMDRQTKRVIGDDANLIRRMPPMDGRIETVDVAPDGKSIVAGSSLDGKGRIRIFSYDFDSNLTNELKRILEKLPSSWSKGEREIVEKYWDKGVKQLADLELDFGVYAASFNGDGSEIAFGGADGKIHIYDVIDNKISQKFSPIEIIEERLKSSSVSWSFPETEHVAANPVVKDVVGINTIPSSIQLAGKTSYAQMVVQAETADGQRIDVTDKAKFAVGRNIVSVDQSGLVQLNKPQSENTTQITIKFQGHESTVPVAVSADKGWRADFIKDVNPVLTRLGCNAGTCHGSQSGKNGFKLSLRGYDAIYDIRSLTDELSARRLNLVRPDLSLMLAKPSADVPHQGGKLLDRKGKYYQIIMNWIENGALLNKKSPRVVSIDIQPKNPTLQKPEDVQQVRVVATYSDDSQRDVTREAFIESGNLEVAKLQGTKITAIRRGESAILARYEGAYAATTATVMGERSNFTWQEPKTNNPIDSIAIKKWKRLKIQPSELSTDSEFIRRVYLDLTGLPPSVEQLEAFLNDNRNTKLKRDATIDNLIGNEAFVEHWTNKWADLLQVNRKFLGVEGASKFRDWIREQVAANVPYNRFVSSVITAGGSNFDNPPASYYKILRTPEDTMENTTHLFLGTRFNCNKCHDHPFEKWTQDQYYETAAFFSRVKIKKDPRSGDKKIGGSAVDSAKPLYEEVSDDAKRNMIHERTGAIVEPKFPFECSYECDDAASRREKFAAWLTASDNRYFASSYVNRLWGYLMGGGLIEPLDDIRAGNPPSNPELLKYLTSEFIESGFNARHIIRMICKSRVYQLSFRTNRFNEDDQSNFSHALPRRLPAEVLYDAVHLVTGSVSKIPGEKPGTRAATLPDSGAGLPSGFLATLGRPTRESACECERSNELQLGSVLAMISGPVISNAINDPGNAIAQLVVDEPDNEVLIQSLYRRVLNRNATVKEVELAANAFELVGWDHEQLRIALKKRQKIATSLLQQLGKRREDNIDSTRKELDETLQSIAPKLLAEEADQRLKLAEAKKALKHYRQDDKSLFEAWQSKQIGELKWHPFRPVDINAETQRAFTINSDRSINASTKTRGQDIYTIVGNTDLSGITGVRLEVLPDPKLDAKGPGTASNGNFVLNEFVLEIAPLNDPGNWRAVPFAKARSFFDQTGYPIENVIDGKLDNGPGWATMGHIGKTNWATLQTELPIGFAGGSKIRIRLHQKYDDSHQIGKFRISFTTFNGTIGLSTSEELSAEITSDFDKFDENRRKELVKVAERDDLAIAELKQAVDAAKVMPEVPEKIAILRAQLERFSKPLAPDAKLAQLEKDFEHSKKQNENRRLTAAQDLTWALINSPEFLFNR